MWESIRKMREQVRESPDCYFPVTQPSRLLLLAEKLETLVLPKGAHFDMETFGNHPKGPKPPQPYADCHTIACAAGWATTIPSFRKAGFHLEWTAHPVKEDELEATIVFKKANAFDAIADFFGLRSNAACDLFTCSGVSLDTPQGVAAMFRSFLKEAARAK